jgi:hypothetical protein
VCYNEYRRAPPRLVHYLWFCIWIQNAHKWDHHIYLHGNNTKQVQQNQMETQESRKTTWVKINTFLARDKAIESNSKGKDDQYIYHMIEYQLSKDKRYLELFRGGSLQINPRSSSQQISIWKRIIIKHHPNKYILDRLK